MGYVLPGWMDEILDFIGINWPNVDEDDYREMADAMREFAEQFEGHGAEAHAAVSRILASSEGAAVDALQEHWDLVKSGHLEKVPDIARLFSDACDVVADIIYGMKTKAEIELGVMAASIGISLGLAVVTGGLSAIIGAAETAAMRQLIKRIIDEAADQIVDELLARVTEPITGRLEQMVEDTVLDLTDNLIKLPPAAGGTGAGEGGHGGSHTGMTLASAGGSSAGGGGGGGGRVFIDHEEYENGAGKLSRHGEAMSTDSLGSLGRAKGAFGRTRGRDPFTQAFDSVLHGALNGAEKALKKVGKHLTEDVPGGLRATSRTHRQNDSDISDRLKALTKGDTDTPKVPGARNNGGRGGKGPDPLNSARDDARHHGVEPDKRVCRTDPVDVASGQMLLEQKDLDLPGVLPLALKRTHLSDYTYGVWFGRSWASTLDERIEVDIRNQAMWAREDGTVLVYEQLPGPQTPEVLPLEGPRIPLRRISEVGAQDLEFAATDPRTGWTRYFSKPGGKGWQLWLTTIEDRNGNQIDIHRDATGRPLDITHSGGYDINVTGDRGRVTALALRGRDDGEPALPVVEFGYDEDGDLTEVINSSGRPLRFTYDMQGRITSWTDRNDSTYRYVYDAAGRVVQTVGPSGMLSSTFVYDTTNRMTRYTDSTGATTVYQLDERLQIVAETDPLGHTTRYVFDARDRILEQTDALGRAVRFERDERGNLVGFVAPDGVRTSAVFNDLDLPVTVTERGGRQRHFAYDARGNRTAVIDVDGARTEYEVDERGHVTAVRNAAGEVTRIRNDAAGLPVEITAPDGARVSLARDRFGRVTEVTDALGGTMRMTWSIEGRPLWRELPDGTREEWAWDGEGNLLAHTDRAGHTTTHVVTHFDRRTATRTADGAAYQFTHDSELRLATVVNAQGQQWRYQYDAAGRLTAETDFDGRTLTYEHDALGRLTRRTNAAGQSLTYERDLLGRIVRMQHDDGTTSTFTHDSAGHLVEVTNPHAQIHLERDPAGRVVTESVNGRALERAYDVLGRRTHRRTPSGATSTLTYDHRGLAAYTAGEQTFHFERDVLGREVSRTLDSQLTFSQTWDPVGRIVNQAFTSPHDTLFERSFAYTPNGTPHTIEDSRAGLRTYTLDAASRITAVTAEGWSEQYAYNTAGDQMHAALPPGTPGQDTAGERTYSGSRITQAGRTRYTYDAQGRLAQKHVTTLSGKHLTWTFTWDAEDRLTQVQAPGDVSWRYFYDALGRRTAKHRLRADGRIEDVTTYCWDGGQLAEQHTNGVTLVWDYTGLHPLAQREAKTRAQGESDRRFFAIVTDLAGAPTDLVAPDGTVAWHSRSTAWGATQSHRDATAYTPLRYPGQYFDPETGLHYNLNRYYDPDLGRYTTPDPLGLAPAVNHYTYVPNPFTLADPLGLAGCTADPTWGGRVTFTRDEHGRPYEMNAIITRDMLDEGTHARNSLEPPGFLGGDYNQARGHMLARMLGGSGDTLDNLFTITQNPTNSPDMRDHEQDIYNAVKDNGEVITYNVYLEYSDDLPDSVPKYIQLEAHGTKGFALDQLLDNPAHEQQQRHRRGLL
jgi:RHS repeat-associated protein